MNPANHLLIASVVYDAVSRVDPGLLNKAAFFWGNIAPDVTPTQALRSHRAKYRLELVHRKLSQTLRGAEEEAGRWRRSYRLGVLCHYYADFCCYAHSDDYPKNLLRHMRHEHRLSRYSRQHRGCWADWISSGRSCRVGRRQLAHCSKPSCRFVCEQNARGINYGVELYHAIEAGCLLVFSYDALSGKQDLARLLEPLCLRRVA